MKRIDPRTRAAKKCIWCHEEYEALAFGKFCSNACKQADKYNVKVTGKYKRCSQCEAAFPATDKRVTKCEECRNGQA